ncbi:PqiC family protein [Pseudoalteromonas umbrosa]|uniref:PqiC family protein n=1 Tax=Pseudoalteromonas umbrosa TaxID=3048489 RepID=UPI0024C232A5|nr:ABC-type transport auxiliary lipoprotein family protein [Pseudoalteromonas sp. B95]MDK1287832.1 ABC-type transport auxiliary lipoprotein family protein [Pseudoalteromonas sp. B95]
MMKLPIYLGLISLLLIGCSSNQNTHKYYKFSDQNLQVPATQKTTGHLYLEDVSILGVSNQQAFIQYTKPNTVNIAHFHFWAEHPENMLTQLTQSYFHTLGLTVVPRALAGDVEKPFFSLKLVLNEFAGHYDKGALLSGSWYLYKQEPDELKLVKTERFTVNSQLNKDGFDALVSAHQKNWIKLLNTINQEALSTYLK